MRIIAGELRGRHIDAVPGDETRPTTDRVREAIASSVISNLESGFEGTRALDAFAGCGALGFEAISRGSAFCLMVDDSQRAVATIKANAKLLGIGRDSFSVVKGDAFALARAGSIGSHSSPFDIVFLDPPYAIGYERVCELISNLEKHGLLADGALIVYQCANSAQPKRKKAHKERLRAGADAMLEIIGDSFEYISTRIYGVTQVHYFAYNRPV